MLLMVKEIALASPSVTNIVHVPSIFFSNVTHEKLAQLALAKSL